MFNNQKFTMYVCRQLPADHTKGCLCRRCGQIITQDGTDLFMVDRDGQPLISMTTVTEGKYIFFNHAACTMDVRSFSFFRKHTRK